ncbi:MAG: Fic family protein, partial [Acidobacteria bacterium]|nr:Fic family protein [Acidobacteriota bacterium]
ALPRGEWKKLPNSVEHPDGTKFEYCPPEHVAQEIENLISLHHEHEKTAVPPDVEAAWLHHRFSLIHPFTDGNGRVARCLATLVLLKANWLPLVITRRDRSTYIAALRSADQGDLKPLVDLFGTLQRKAIREALSLGEEVIHEATKIGGILAAVKEKFNKRRADHSVRIKRAIKTADSLQVLASHRLKDVATEIHVAICEEGENYKAYMRESQREKETARYYYHQIVQCAKALGYFANLPFYQAWALLCIRTDHQAEILFSFHGIGQETSGVLGCSAMLFTREKSGTGETVVGEVKPLTDAPFEFTYVEESADVQNRFRRWLDKCVLTGLEEWRKTV